MEEASKPKPDNGIRQLLVGIRGSLETALEYSGCPKLPVETSHQVSSSTNTVIPFHYMHVKRSTEPNNGQQ
jgi:hypothetical protein